MIYDVCVAPHQHRHRERGWDRLSEAVERTMRKIPNSNRRLSEQILRALNKIRKPSTAGEITELLNRDLDLDDRPFQAEHVEEWLRSADYTAFTLYWSRARPRK
jgi:hypothetical protein